MEKVVKRKFTQLNTDKIARYVWMGRHDQHWYADCRKTFIELFGIERLELVCKLFAATSINTSLKANITLFRKAYYEIENGMEVGRYLPNIQNQLARIRSGEDLSGRKISSFAKAMAGDKNAVVVDVWQLRAFDMDSKYTRHTGAHEGQLRSSGASDAKYTKIENYTRQEAAGMGLHPCEMSAMIWSGVRIHHTGDRNTHYKEILKRELTNLFNVI